MRDACPIYPGKRYQDWELDDAGKIVEAVRPIRDETDGVPGRSPTSPVSLPCWERLFGTDGIRGVAGTELTEGCLSASDEPPQRPRARRRVTRCSWSAATRGPRCGLEEAFVEGIGATATFIAGVEPTPAIAFLIADLGAWPAW